MNLKPGESHKRKATEAEQFADIIKTLRENYNEEVQEPYMAEIPESFTDPMQCAMFIEQMNNLLAYANVSTLSVNAQIGEILAKIRDFCKVQEIKFFDLLKEASFRMKDPGYVYFLIRLYRFKLDYPRIGKVALPFHYFRNNLGIISKALVAHPEEAAFWKQPSTAPKVLLQKTVYF